MFATTLKRSTPEGTVAVFFRNKSTWACWQVVRSFLPHLQETLGKSSDIKDVTPLDFELPNVIEKQVCIALTKGQYTLEMLAAHQGLDGAMVRIEGRRARHVRYA